MATSSNAVVRIGTPYVGDDPEDTQFEEPREYARYPYIDRKVVNTPRGTHTRIGRVLGPMFTDTLAEDEANADPPPLANSNPSNLRGELRLLPATDAAGDWFANSTDYFKEYGLLRKTILLSPKEQKQIAENNTWLKALVR